MAGIKPVDNKVLFLVDGLRYHTFIINIKDIKQYYNEVPIFMIYRYH